MNKLKYISLLLLIVICFTAKSDDSILNAIWFDGTPIDSLPEEPIHFPAEIKLDSISVIDKFIPDRPTIKGNDFVFIVGTFTVHNPVHVRKNGKGYIIPKEEYDINVNNLDTFLLKKESYNIICFDLNEILTIKETLRYSKWVNGKFSKSYRTRDKNNYIYYTEPQKYLVVLIKGVALKYLLSWDKSSINKYVDDLYYKYIIYITE